MVNHTNTATLGLGDAFESPLADPMVHVTAYLDDAFSLELVYVPFLAPDLVGIDELEFDLTFLNYDIDARFGNPRLPLFSQWAHSVHAALSYTSFVVDAQVTYSFFRDQTPDFDLSGIRETARTVDGRDPLRHQGRRGAGLLPRPQLRRRRERGAGRMGYIRRRRPQAHRERGRLPHRRQAPGDPLRRAGGPRRLHRPAAVQRVGRPVSPADPARRRGTEVGVQPADRDRGLYALRDFYLLQEEPSTVYVVGRLDTSLFRETLNVGVIGAWGITEEALHLAPRAKLRLSDYVSAAAGANLWYSWKPGIASGLLTRDDAKDNVFAQLVVRY